MNPTFLGRYSPREEWGWCMARARTMLRHARTARTALERFEHIVTALRCRDAGRFHLRAMRAN